MSLFQLIELTEVTEDTIELEDEDIFDGEDELFQVIDLWLKIINIISCLFSRKKTYFLKLLPLIKYVGSKIILCYLFS